MAKRHYKFVIILGLLLVIFIVFGIYKLYSNEQAQKNEKDPELVLEKQNNFIKNHDYLSEGTSDEIHVVAFTDYRCPHCADYHKNIKSKMLQSYIDNGTIKYTEMQYPVIDKLSKQYEIMSLIIQKHGTLSDFKTFSDKANQSSSVDNDPIKTLKRIDLSDKDEKDMIDIYKNNPPKSNKSKIKAELKVTSTPTIFVNGKYIKDTNVLEDAIKQEQGT
ncbi:DsbA family protein [Staphylococcus equorum]|uniref:DsbA family protein n=1 Tax=Staphylococcus equorum TaxID=246432 RepID=UPI003FD6DC62